MPSQNPRPDGLTSVGIDPDVDLSVPAERREWDRRRELVPVIAVGGMIGASSRYAVTLAIPASTPGWPWATLLINATGCFLLGLLMVWVAERGSAHPLVRPFVGVGVLGGYTTFSTYAAEGHHLIQAGRPLLGLVYLWGTVVVAMAAVTAGAQLGRVVGGDVDRRRGRTGDSTVRDVA